MKVVTFLYILLILSYFGVSGQTNQPVGVTTTQQTDSQPAYLCDIGYFFNGQICVACLTIAGGKCTCSASNGCDTLSCSDGYYQVGQSCISIPDTNCQRGGLAADGTSIVCYSCNANSGTTLIGGICVTNNSCLTFDLSTGVCTKCANGFYNVMAEFTPSEYYDTSATTWTQSNYPKYYQNINQCKTCNADASCKTCNFLKQCTECIDNYYLSGTTCTQCIAGCQKCSDTTTCSVCLPTYNLTNSNTCVQCTNTQFFDTSNKTCADCTTGNGTNCTACSNSTTCTTCANDFYPVSGTCKTCTGYPSTCSACDTNSNCTSCASVSSMSILQGGVCKQCPTNCQSVSNCSYNTQTSATICSLCKDLYYVTSSGLCATCDSAGESNALRCHYDATVSGNIVYTQCKSPYFLANNKCTQAQSTNTCAKLLIPTDQTAISNQSCSDCWPGLIQNGSTCFSCNFCQAGSCTLNTNNSKSCTSCVDGYYSDSSQQCQTCISNCTTCTGPAIGDCTNCQAGYFKGASSCTACTVDSNNHTTCLVCQDATNCSSCINGYYILNGQCMSCQYGCNQCIAPGNVCSACISGYYLQNGGCVQDNGNCYSTDSSNVLTTAQQNQTNGCQICNYGFFLTSGWLTQSTSSQIQDYACMQCVYPQNAFVCRTNPSDVSIQTVQTTTTTIQPSSQYFSKGAIVSNISNFNLLDTRYTTATCASGYFWTNQSCMPCVSVNYGICTTCTNLTACTQITCNSGYFLTTINTTQLCAPMPTGCSELTYATNLLALACSKCNTGYTLVQSICIANSGCLTISASNGICTQCQEGYYFNWDFQLTTSNAPTTNAKYYTTFNQFCSPCQAGCQICPSQYTCTQCLPGYFWYQSTVTNNPQTFIKFSSSLTSNMSGQCVQCPKYCQTCSSATTCNTCYPNFQADSSSTVGACMCPQGFNLTTSGSTFACTQQVTTNPTCSITACSQCNSDNTQCLSCLSSFQGKSYTLSGTTCVTCSSNCSQCTLMSGSTSQTTCQACQNGYYKTQSANDQPVLCSICSQTGSLLCQGPLENATFTTVTVIQCQNNYYLYNGACVAVPTTATCQTISSSSASTCQQCLPGYTLFGSTCQACATNKNLSCLTCTANGDNTGLQCTSCQPGYVIDSTNNVCVACSSGCTRCTLIAATQNTLQSTSCSACNDGNYLDNTTAKCFACPYDCKTCDSRYTCTTCKDGFYMKQTQSTFNAKQYNFKPCYPCQSNCATCTSPNGNVCLTCSQGYVIQNGGCINLSDSTTSPNYALANCYQPDPTNTGCLNCLAGFYLDAQKVCQECVSPYNNFVCGLKAVSPTNPVGPSPNPTPNPTPTDNTIQIGTNPASPSSYSIMLGMLIIIVLQ